MSDNPILPDSESSVNLPIPFNQFRVCDASEFIDTLRACIPLSLDEINARQIALNERMKRLEQEHGYIPSYLLAAYRGYEHTIALRTTHRAEMVVKIDDREPLLPYDNARVYNKAANRD